MEKENWCLKIDSEKITCKKYADALETIEALSKSDARGVGPGGDTALSLAEKYIAKEWWEEYQQRKKELQNG